MKERHLEGTALIKRGAGAGSAIFEPLARPDLFITDAERTLMVVPRRKERDAVLLGVLTRTNIRLSCSFIMAFMLQMRSHQPLKMHVNRYSYHATRRRDSWNFY